MAVPAPSITKLVIMGPYGRQFAAGATEIGADRGRTDAAPGSGPAGRVTSISRPAGTWQTSRDGSA